MSDKIFEYLNKNWQDLNQNELKSYAIFGFFFYEFIGIFISLLFYITLNLPIFIFKFFILGFSIFAIMGSIISYKRDFLDKKYGLFSFKYNGIAYSGMVLFFIPGSIVFAFIIYITLNIN